VFFCFEKG